MVARGRIFNTDATAATGEFQIGDLAVDGDDNYDTSNFTITELSDGRVVVGFVRSYLEAPSSQEPRFTIIDPSVAPDSPGFTVTADMRINDALAVAHADAGPPIIVALPGAGGRFVADWVNEYASDGHLMAKVFDSSGRAVSDEVMISNADFNRVSGSNGFDWDNFTLVAIDANRFAAGWVGASDGNGTGVYSTVVRVGIYTNVAGRRRRNQHCHRGHDADRR